MFAETADVSVPVFGASMSRSNWSSDTLSEMATVGVGKDPDKVGVG